MRLHHLNGFSAKREAAGFTLIELLITISIIAVLSTIGVVVYTSVQKNVRDQKRFQDLKSIERFLEGFRAKSGYYPMQLSELSLYLDPLPTDPKPDYTYTYQPQPVGCDNSSSYCGDFLLCGVKEGNSSLETNPNCLNLSCSVDDAIDCGLGFSAR